ncbi:MAG: peptide chain release factor N(5)-glutamine methyltransferase [Candidatus Omnitrophica bacterium]|nr:peptide chain release factor N(5)-glutamine methyltransferase [Candidatus Omnitrophota bacterium]
MTDDELFLTAILRCSRSDLYTQAIPLTADQQKQFDDMKHRRANGEPVQYIVGFTEFMGLRMDVGPGVLIPRPETEVLVDYVLQELSVEKKREYFILDIGTGSGCIAIAFAKMLPGCRVISVDISETALAFARRNAEINGVKDRITFVERDVFWFMDENLDRFDAVISNPPYIPTFQMDKLPQDVQKEPGLALDGGPDGLHFYRFLIPSSLRKLKTGGLLAFEFGDGQRKELEKLFDEVGGWDKIRFNKDNVGKFRVAVARKQGVI